MVTLLKVKLGKYCSSIRVMNKTINRTCMHGMMLPDYGYIGLVDVNAHTDTLGILFRNTDIRGDIGCIFVLYPLYDVIIQLRL